jgi:hypothetical protein
MRYGKVGNLISGNANMTEPAPHTKPRTALLIWLILSQLLALGSLLIWLVVAGLSVMAFDAGVTAEAWTFVIVVWSYPLFPLVMIVGAWIAFAKQWNKTAAVLSGLSFAPPILLYLVMWIGNSVLFLPNGF